MCSPGAGDVNLSHSGPARLAMGLQWNYTKIEPLWLCRNSGSELYVSIPYKNKAQVIKLWELSVLGNEPGKCIKLNGC